jgi:hypothetical protein
LLTGKPQLISDACLRTGAELVIALGHGDPGNLLPIQLKLAVELLAPTEARRVQLPLNRATYFAGLMAPGHLL